MTEHQSSPAASASSTTLEGVHALGHSLHRCYGASYCVQRQRPPGVMMAGTARGFANRQAVAVGGKIAVFTNVMMGGERLQIWS